MKNYFKTKMKNSQNSSWISKNMLEYIKCYVEVGAYRILKSN